MHFLDRVGKEKNPFYRRCDNIPPMSSELLERITFDLQQCGGRPCIRGMRIRVKDVLDMLAGGASEEEILADFPYLEPDDIRASLEYAAAQIDHSVITAQ
jgi:uncharacterized protein (DUF433 family)